MPAIKPANSEIQERPRTAAPAAARNPARARQPKTVTPVTPVFSVVVLNYNGAAWLDRCLGSLARQTLAARIEVLVADNASTDNSDWLAADLMGEQPGWRVIRNHKNLGYCGGNNRAAGEACGEFLLFLNTDTWLEPDCLERLLAGVRASGAVAATPLVMDYRDDTMQSCGESGFDIFGLLSGPVDWSKPREVFVACGPALLVRADWFNKLGGFDDEFFMYADEYDLCWRVWLAGGRVMLVPDARLHHRGAVAVNPAGGEQTVEIRTSDTKRFYTNRNCLLVLLKNARRPLLLLVPLQVLLLAAETLLTAALTRRFAHFRRAWLGVLGDCWRLRRHILAERRRLQPLRRHGDFWMLRFLRPGLNRWRELRRFARFGPPKIDGK